MWFNKFIQIFKIRDLRNKILFVFGVFVVFRIMANIPMPGINIENLRIFLNQYQVLGFLSAFTGGTLDTFSIVMLGLGPYITATIILQLLTMIFPRLGKMYKEEGEAGRRKFNQYGRLLTLPLAMLQSYGMLVLLQNQKIISGLSPFLIINSILTISAGTFLLMWLGELISEKGIGNGVSLLIFAGIVADAPSNLMKMILQFQTGSTGHILNIFLFFLMALIIIGGVVLINEARRNIPVSYAKRVRGFKMYGGVSTYLPLNINPAGVIPIIFALSILLFPVMFANFLSGWTGIIGVVSKNIGNFFNPQTNPLVYGIFYFVLVIIFTYFYTAVTFDPKSISQNLQKMGGFIPGIRPGSATSDFLYFILNRVLFIGALFLGTVAVMPSIVQATTGIFQFEFLIGGTSLLIVVSVVLDFLRQIQAQLKMKEYETF